MEPQSFCTKTQFPLPQNCFLFVFFFFFLTSIDFPPPPSGNIHRCAKPPLTATLAEAKNEIYTWLPSSTMCNHHLIGKWSRLQTGKGKAWLKPSRPRADNAPARKQGRAELEEQELCRIHSPSQHRQTHTQLGEKGQGRDVHGGVGWWPPQYPNLLSCLLRKIKQVPQRRSHESFFAH